MISLTYVLNSVCNFTAYLTPRYTRLYARLWDSPSMNYIPIMNYFPSPYRDYIPKMELIQNLNILLTILKFSVCNGVDSILLHTLPTSSE